MKNAVLSFIGKIDPRVILFVLLIVLLVLAAGAPSANGGVGM